MTKRLLIPKSWSGIRLFMSLLLLVTATFPMLALRLDQSEMTLKRGTTVELTATRGTEAGALSWVVKPEGIASIKPYATNPLICGVTGEKAGDAVVTAQVGTSTTAVMQNCKVKVWDLAIESTDLVLTEGDKIDLAEKVQGVNLPEGWEIMFNVADRDNNVVSLSGSTLEAKAAGSTDINADLFNVNGLEERVVIKVTVKAKEINAKSITLNYKEANLTEGETLLLEAIVDPVNATVPVIWTSSDENVVTVDETGKVVAVKPGKGVITATAKTATGTTEATCTVDVKAKEINAKSITLNYKEANLTEGETLLLEAIVDPVNATVPVIWTSSDENVVTVDETGKVVAVKPGKGVITATAKTATGTTEA
ncbi:MAG: Ig-like domain-containing protein, partial [Paramuribaculum sp.]